MNQQANYKHFCYGFKYYPSPKFLCNVESEDNTQDSEKSNFKQNKAIASTPHDSQESKKSSQELDNPHQIKNFDQHQISCIDNKKVYSGYLTNRKLPSQASDQQYKRLLQDLNDNECNENVKKNTSSENFDNNKEDDQRFSLCFQVNSIQNKLKKLNRSSESSQMIKPNYKYDPPRHRQISRKIKLQRITMILRNLKRNLINNVFQQLYMQKMDKIVPLNANKVYPNTKSKPNQLRSHYMTDDQQWNYEKHYHNNNIYELNQIEQNGYQTVNLY